MMYEDLYIVVNDKDEQMALKLHRLLIVVYSNLGDWDEFPLGQ